MRSTRHGVTSWISQVTVTPVPLSWLRPESSTVPVTLASVPSSPASRSYPASV